MTEAINFQVFSDASIIGIVFALTGTSQRLVAAKSRLSKNNLTIPRLELVAMHMTPNLCKNIKYSLEKQPVRKFYGWTDSSVALPWSRGSGTYKQVVSNRVNIIRENAFIN